MNPKKNEQQQRLDGKPAYQHKHVFKKVESEWHYLEVCSCGILLSAVRK